MKIVNRKDIDSQTKEESLIREVQILKELVRPVGFILGSSEYIETI
jgi:hypothetical protein